MVLAHHIKNWLDKKDQEFRDKLRAEGREEARAEARKAIAEARAENQQAWIEWNTRRLDAESRGENFTEPPPNGEVK